jgi:hypothetical protein
MELLSVAISAGLTLFFYWLAHHMAAKRSKAAKAWAESVVYFGEIWGPVALLAILFTRKTDA